MTSTIDNAARHGLTAAHEALTAARGTPAADAALDAVMRAEDSTLAAPLDLSTMGLRAGIALRRLRVAADDPGAPGWSTLGHAIEDMDGALAECFGAIGELVRVAQAHRAAIVAGNAPGGRRGALDPAREGEVAGIEESIAAGRVILRAAGIEAE